MPKNEGGGVASAEMHFAVDSNGNFVVILADFPAAMRPPLQSMLATIISKGLEAMNAEIAAMQRAGVAAGLAIPLGPRGTD